MSSVTGWCEVRGLRASLATAFVAVALSSLPAHAATAPSAWDVTTTGSAAAWLSVGANTTVDLSRSTISTRAPYAGFVIASENGASVTGKFLSSGQALDLGPIHLALRPGRYRLRTVAGGSARIRIATSGRGGAQRVRGTRDDNARVVATDETVVGGAPLLSIRKPLTSRRSLVFQVLDVTWDLPVGADDLRVCVAASAVPCTPADADGVAVLLAPRDTYTRFVVSAARRFAGDEVADAVYELRGADHVTAVRTTLAEFAL